jgi:hypothetical protein
MKTRSVSVQLLVLGILTYSISASGQMIVYDAPGGTTAYATVNGPTPGAAGDLVTLTSGATTITSFSLPMLGQGTVTSPTADLALNFYNVGPNVTDPLTGMTGPSVGTQIDSTFTLTAVPLQNGTFNVTFNNLNLAVPGNVIWAVSVMNLTTGMNLSWTIGTPTVGSSDSSFAYLNIPGSGLIAGTLSSLGQPPTFDLNVPSLSNLAATITAVPEPVLYPALFGVLCLGGIWAKRLALAGR